MYEKTSTDPRTISLPIVDVAWPMPDKYFLTIGATFRGFSFLFPKAFKTIKDNFISTNNLLNIIKRHWKNIERHKVCWFFPEEKKTNEKFAEYNPVPIWQFINESYFLYNRSNLIKETFITAINKKNIYWWFAKLLWR